MCRRIGVDLKSPSPKSSSALSSRLILFALTHLQTFVWNNQSCFENLLFQHLIACRHNLEGMLQRSQRFGGVYFPISPIKAPSKSCQKHMYVNTFLGALLPGHPGKAIRIHLQGILKGRYCGKPYPGHRPPPRPSAGPTVLDPADGPDSSPSPRLDTRLPPPGEHGEDFLATTSGPPDSSPPPPPSKTLMKTMVKTLVNFRRILKGSRN